MFKTRGLVLAVLGLAGAGLLMAGGAPPAPPAASDGAAARPAATQAAPPETLDAAHLKPVALLGDPRFRHAGMIASLTVADGGRQLISCGYDGTARVWDAASGREIHRVQFTPPIHETDREIRAAQLLPDGKRLVTCCEDRVMLWDLETGKSLRVMTHEPKNPGFTAPENGVRCLALTPDGKQVYAGDVGGRVFRWDLETAQKVSELRVPAGSIVSMALSRDGKVLVTGSKTVTVWDTATGEVLHSIQAPGNWILAVAINPQTGALVGVSDENTLFTWDAAGKELWKTAVPKETWRVAFSPDGRTLALGEGSGQIKLLSATDGKEQIKIDLPPDSLAPGRGGLAFSADGKEVYGVVDNMIGRWDATTGQRRFPAPQDGRKYAYGGTGDLALAADGQRLYRVASGRGVYVWNLAGGNLEDVWEIADGAYSFHLSANGRRLLVGTQSGVVILDAATGKALTKIKTEEPSSQVFWGEGEKTVVAGGGEPGFWVWNLETSSSRWVGEPPSMITGRMGPRAISEDGRRVITTSTGAVEIWSPGTGEKLTRFGGSSDGTKVDWDTYIGIAQFVPGRTAVVTISDSGQVSYWDRRAPATQPAMPRPEVLAGWAKDLGAPDFPAREKAMANLIAVGPAAENALAQAEKSDPEVTERTRKVHVGWEKLTVPDHQVGRSLSLHERPSSLGVHPDGKHWAAVLDGGAASVVVLGELTPAGPKELRRLNSEGHGASGLLFSSDGKTLYVGNGDSTISIYRAEKQGTRASPSYRVDWYCFWPVVAAGGD